MDFRTELTTLLNRFSIENKSNTADYILSEYIIDCLQAYDKAVLQRDKHSIPTENTLQENPYGVQLKSVVPPTEGLKTEPNGPIPAKVGNTTTSGWTNPFAGTSWGV